MADDLPLAGLRIEGFRSFAPNLGQRIGPLSKVHLLAGPNNSGKSNVLRVAQRVLPALADRERFQLKPSDRPYGDAEAALRVAIARDSSPDELRERLGLTVQADFFMRLMGDGSVWDPDEGLLWIEFEAQFAGNPLAEWVASARQAERVTQAAENLPNGRRQLGELSERFTSMTGGERLEDARRVLDRIVELLEMRTALPMVQTLDAFRRIEPSQSSELGDLNGPGLIERLARLQHPQFGQEGDRERFDRINVFLGTLFDDAETTIEIQHDHQQILVAHAGRRLPLPNYGTGVHQAVILAAAATVLSGHLICIEEPEVHLHPTLQRKLLRYLHEQTDNQYLIATHSAHMLDAAYASISAVRQVDGASQVATALTPHEVSAIGAELGMRASDLVQSNAVIWVEGPSDRLYLKAWLEELAPELVEGVHFSLVFYGGALLRHLSPDDPAVKEFITLPRINRNLWIVIDSDRHAEDEELGDTKMRVRDVLREYPGLGGAWVTAGYTIENYVPPELLGSAIKEVHPRSEPSWAGELFVNPLAPEQLGGRRSPPDKAAVAQAVVQGWRKVGEWPLDLRERLDEVVSMIRRANDLG